MGLQQFERRLERLVEGAFTRAFRSGVQPVELGRRVLRELDADRELGVHGTVAPNSIQVALASGDFDHYSEHVERIRVELADLAREHAREQEYRFVGPVQVDLVVDARLKRGACRIDARIVPGEDAFATIVRTDGTRIPLGEEVSVIGRLPESVVCLTDREASRQHAEIRPVGDGYVLVDLGSTNGTMLNGSLVREQRLKDGDVITIGSTKLRFEEA